MYVRMYSYSCIWHHVLLTYYVMTSVHIALPLIYVHPLDRIIEINSTFMSIVLTCMAYGASSYEWLKDNNTIQLNTAGNMTNSLLLINILPSDSGLYQCVAKNNYGRAYSDYAELTVEGRNVQSTKL